MKKYKLTLITERFLEEEELDDYIETMKPLWPGIVKLKKNMELSYKAHSRPDEIVETKFKLTLI